MRRAGLTALSRGRLWPAASPPGLGAPLADAPAAFSSAAASDSGPGSGQAQSSGGGGRGRGRSVSRFFQDGKEPRGLGRPPQQGRGQPGSPRGGRGERPPEGEQRRPRTTPDDGAFASLMDGNQHRHGRSSHRDGGRRAPSQGRARGRGGPRGGRHTEKGSYQNSSWASNDVEGFQTFKELHAEKDFMAHVYAAKDTAWKFNPNMPGPWEHKQMPTLESLVAEADTRLEASKDDMFSDFAESIKSHTVTGRGEDGLVKPGDQENLVQPVNQELERSWKMLKEYTIQEVVSQKVVDLQRRLKAGETLLGVKQEEQMLKDIADQIPESHAGRGAVLKYLSVVEANADWPFSHKRRVMLGMVNEMKKI